MRTDAVFVLMQTPRPHAGMKKIIKDIYFTAGISAISHGAPKSGNGENVRAYMGYSGWAPGQLADEIDRGDWLVVKADPSIIFKMPHKEIWNKLHKAGFGRWI